MSGTPEDRNLECLVCELVESIEDPDDEPVLHQIVAPDETDAEQHPAGPYICDQCLQLLIEWKHERNVMVLSDEGLPDDVLQELESAVKGVAANYDAVSFDGRTKNAHTASESS
jgi:hypothetical protein